MPPRWRADDLGVTPTGNVVSLPPVAPPPAAARQAGGEPNPYDFRRPTKISRDQTRALQVGFETFARRAATLFTSRLRQVCTVTIADTSQRGYDDYVDGLASPSVSVLLGIDPLPGSGTLNLSLPLALAMIDHLLGGPGGQQPERRLTEIEVTVLRGLLEQLGSVLRESFEYLVGMECSVGSIEYAPQFLQAANPSDAVVVVEFELAIGEAASALSLSLPVAALLPALDALRPRQPEHLEADAAALHHIERSLSAVSLPIRVEFEPAPIDAQRALNLGVGDIVKLPHRAGTPLRVRVGDVLYARALAGQSGANLAVMITSSGDRRDDTTVHQEMQ